MEIVSIQSRTYIDYFSVILLCFYVPDYKSRHVSMFLTTKQDIFKTNGFPLKPYYFNIMAHWKILCFNKWQKHFNTLKCLVLLYNLFLVSIVSLHVSSKCILQYSTMFLCSWHVSSKCILQYSISKFLCSWLQSKIFKTEVFLCSHTILTLWLIGKYYVLTNNDINILKFLVMRYFCIICFITCIL